MDITTVIINFQTPDLLETAVLSFKEIYPEISLLIIDNGSQDQSIEVINKLKSQLPKVESYLFDENIYHGPAMDFAARYLVKTEFIFFLDSDTETTRAGFLEKMMAKFDAEKIYGAGETTRVNKRGFKSEKGLKILLTPYMLLKRDIYLQLPPFVHHGQPTLYNYKMAHQLGYSLKEFPISDYIKHHWRGTANRFGYGLGWKGRLDFLLNKLGL